MKIDDLVGIVLEAKTQVKYPLQRVAISEELAEKFQEEMIREDNIIEKIPTEIENIQSIAGVPLEINDRLDQLGVNYVIVYDFNQVLMVGEGEM